MADHYFFHTVNFATKPFYMEFIIFFTSLKVGNISENVNTHLSIFTLYIAKKKPTMNKETLDSLKETLALDSAIDIGRFGIFYDSSESREGNYYIKANKEGLKMFAYQLLCASKDLEDQEKDNLFEKIALIPDGNAWIDKDSEIRLLYVESSALTKDLVSTASKETWKDRFTEVGCALIAIFLFISLFVGIDAIFTYLTP